MKFLNCTCPDMRLNIRHRTRYRYSAPIEYGLQLIRLTPLDHAGQRVHGWTVSTDDGQALPLMLV